MMAALRSFPGSASVLTPSICMEGSKSFELRAMMEKT